MENKNFDYYKLDVRLKSEQLGTCSEVSPYNEHVIKKAQKMIKQANALTGKVTKQLDKYRGTDEIPEEKHYGELAGIIRRFQELLGRKEELPKDLEKLLDYCVKLEEDFDSLVSKGEERRATIFMRGDDGWPIISTHMFIGNFKENLRISVNHSALEKDKRLLPSKVSVGEVMAQDVKPVEFFVRPSKDVVRDENGKPFLCERPIVFERMGKKETAIALSEMLPVDTEYSLHLRVRKDSLLNINDGEPLRRLLDLGKNNGLGQWRGSGSRGSYWFKLTKVEKDPSLPPEGWH